LPTTIAIESKTVSFRGVNTPFQHLYLVKTVTDASGDVLDERVIRGDVGGDLTLVTQADIPLAASADRRGSDTLAERNHRVLDLGGRDPEQVWSLMVQHAVNIDKAGLQYGVDSFEIDNGGDVNSNTTVASALHTVGISLVRNLPPSVERNEIPLYSRLDAMVVDDVLSGGALNDIIRGGVGRDNVRGNDGNDRIYGENSGDNLRGGFGNDLLDGGVGNDRMAGADGNDIYRVDSRLDRVVETDTSATGGVDRVESAVSFDLLGRAGTAGIEELVLRGRGDLVGSGNTLGNYIAGNGGDNKIVGKSGDDSLSGMAGDDRVSGQLGNDSLRGGSGDDDLIGGLGSDILRGDRGNDAFVFNSVAESLAGETTRDVIQDFTAADTIDLTRIDANALAAGNQAFTFVGSAAFTGAGQLRFEADGLGNTLVQANVNGDLAADFEVLLQGTTRALDRDDFLL
jgi:Ca2+-binding RTX toxin-like protein